MAHYLHAPLCCFTGQQLREHVDSLATKNVELQRDVDKLPGMKKQLESYKQMKCEAVSRQVSSAVDCGALLRLP